MLELRVLVVARLLVLRERRSAAGAPLRRAVPLVQPAALVDRLQEAPDVLDVRVRERVVVVVPVHPHSEALGLVRDHLGEVSDAFLAALRKLGEAVLLDVPLGVEPKRLLDLYLDPESLTVEAVLVALVETPERLVALEHVLERSPPGVMNAHRVVRRDRPVDEAEPRPPVVLVPELGERALALPAVEDLELERVVVGLVRKRCEDRRHAVSVRSAAPGNTQREDETFLHR